MTKEEVASDLRIFASYIAAGVMKDLDVIYNRLQLYADELHPLKEEGGKPNDKS